MAAGLPSAYKSSCPLKVSGKKSAFGQESASYPLSLPVSAVKQTFISTSTLPLHWVQSWSHWTTSGCSFWLSRGFSVLSRDIAVSGIRRPVWPWQYYELAGKGLLLASLLLARWPREGDLAEHSASSGYKPFISRISCFSPTQHWLPADVFLERMGRFFWKLSWWVCGVRPANFSFGHEVFDLYLMLRTFCGLQISFGHFANWLWGVSTREDHL